jgi:hypothetical protein
MRLGSCLRRLPPGTAGVVWLLWQKVIGRAIDSSAESVEIGVHRGLLVDGVIGTAGFGLSAPNPFCTDISVESIICGG